jgi:hypothetical protein
MAYCPVTWSSARDGRIRRRRRHPDDLDEPVDHLGGEAHVVGHGAGGEVLDAGGMVLETFGKGGEVDVLQL